MNIFDLIGGLLNQPNQNKKEVKVPYKLEEDSYEEVEEVNAEQNSKEDFARRQKRP